MNGAVVAALAAALLITTLTSCSSSTDTADSCGHRPAPVSQASAAVQPTIDLQWEFAAGESTFSSPQAADLNGDSVLDVVLGLGQDTLGAGESSLVAIDGATGTELWRSSGHEDLIGSAAFAQLGGDETLDVVIGGRRGALIAVDGRDGSLLWEFDDEGGRWFNFYSPQVIDDVNEDGVPEVVAANGGLVFDEPAEGPGVHATDPRHLGYVFVIDGRDGSVLGSSPVPDRGESYMSAPVSDGEILVGTGGETLPGSLWRIPVDAVLAEQALTPDTAGVERLIDGGPKGMIAAPSLGHLTSDCVLDIVSVGFGGTISAVDGSAGSELWSVDNPGFESYSSPTLGWFVGDDDIPDMFVSVARGVWPQYEESDYLVIDGASGEVAWRTTAGTFAPSGFVAADLNDDGRDEVIFGVNDVAADTVTLMVLDLAGPDTTATEARPLAALPQTTFAAPWIGDLDANGQLDLIVVISAYQSDGPAVIRRYVITGTADSTVSWGGYLGSTQNGRVESW